MLKFCSSLMRNKRRFCAVRSVRSLIATTFGLLLAATASAQTLQLTSNAYSVNEDNGTIRVAVRRIGDVKLVSTVQLSAVGSTAIDGQDFVARTSTLTFPTNATEAFFDLVILDNDKTNANKVINLTLSNANGGAIDPIRRTATIDILDDESGLAGFSTGFFEFSSDTYTVTDYEGTVRNANLPSYPGANITVVRKGGNRGRVTVDVATGGGTAYPNVLYRPVATTLVFDDYQMSASFIVPILQYTNFPNELDYNFFNFTLDDGTVTNFSPLPAGLHLWPFEAAYITNTLNNCPYLVAFKGTPQTNGQFTFLRYTISGFTWDVNLVLSNPDLDPLEEKSLSKPTLGPKATAGLGIVFVDSLKTANGAVIPQQLGHSLERAHYRTSEAGGGPPRGISFYQMWVNRDFCPDSDLVRYEVNNENSNAVGGDHLNRTFKTEAGSDYATPFADYIPPGTPEWYVSRGLDPSSIDDGTVTWSPPEAGPKPLTIPILPDDKVEFDEDLIVQLFQRDGDPGSTAFPPLAPYGPAPTRAVLTIVYDNIRFVNEDMFHYSFDTNGVFGSEQPAGAGDRRYNRHGEFDIDPPFNLTPGANASVLAVAAGQDGKLLLGGEFDSVNNKKEPWVKHFARMTRDGQVDTNFVIGSGPNEAVTAIELQPDGKAIIGGLFSSYSGQLRNGLARVNANGSLDTTFNPGLGANAPVRAVKLLPSGKVLIGGEFTSFNGTNVNYLARLNANGSLDTSFNANGSGPNDFVYSIAISGEPMIIDLKSLDVDQAQERADIYDTGSNQGLITLDYDFGPNADNIRIYYNGQLLADTLRVAGQGSISVPYGPGPVNTTLISIVVNEGNPGLFGTVASWAYHLTVTPALDALPVIGGRFSQYNGIPRNRVARILPEGGLDTQFDSGAGIENGIVFSVAKHGNKPVVGGVFSTVNRLSRNNIVQLNPDGSVDTSFDPGSGFNDIVYSVIVQPTGKPLCGGLFSEFNGSRRITMARLNHDGKLDTTFMDTAYNQFAGLPNPYTWMPENSVNAMVNIRLTNSYFTSITVTNSDNTVTNRDFNFIRIEDQLFIGGSFIEIGGGFTRDSKIPRKNFARVVGDSTPGPGMVGFMFDRYTVDEDAGSVFIVANRDQGHLGAITSPVFTVDLPQGSGAATEGVDYNAASTSVQWPTARTVGNFSRQVSESYRGPNSAEYFVTDQEPRNGLPGTNSVAPRLSWPLFISVNDDNIQEGDEDLQLNFSVGQTIITLGGEPIPTWPALGRSVARLGILDNDFSPGVIGFSNFQYFVDENVKKARITLTRTNGAAGRVTVDVRTRTPGSTATANVDFVPISVLTIVFGPGQTSAFFDIEITDDSTAELDETVSLGLANATGGASIGLGAATLTIIDNDFSAGRIQFTVANIVVDEGAGTATIVVRRTGGSTGTSQVLLSTADLTAQAGIDYVGLTNVVLRWSSGDTADKVITIPIRDLPNIEQGNLSFQVVLSNPTVNGVAEPNALGNQKQMIVEIQNNDSFGNLRISQPAYVVDENGTNAVITVIRVNGVSGELTVDYAATAETAIAGQDFTPVAGSLTFTNNQIAASFSIPILDDSFVDGTKTIRIDLANQVNTQGGVSQPGALTFPSTNVLVSIIDNELENIPAGSLDVTFLSEGANDFIYAVAQQPDGQLVIGGDFTLVNSVPRNRLARLKANGTLDESFFAPSPNASVRALAIQPDDRILIAGNFTNVGTTTRSYIARLVRDGGIDTTFDPGAGANNPVYAVLVQADNRILIGGEFSAYGPTPANGLARLLPNGGIDSTFKPGTGASGSRSFTVFGIAQQIDGKILVVGDFEAFNNVPAKGIVRLNLDGSVDTSFNTSIGANGSVRTVAIQSDGRILVGGLFTTMQGSPANHVARLNVDGTLDNSFNAAGNIPAAQRGADGPVLSIALQIDNKIVLGGDFSQYNGVTRRGITRLNSDGSNDVTINFGSGVNGSVAAVVVQPDRKIVLAGGFTEYDGQPRLRLARINGGSLAGSGRIEFARATFTASETSTNVVITVRRTGGTAGAVQMNFTTQPDPTVPADSAATAGQDYGVVSGTLLFPEGETQASFKVPITNDGVVESEEIFGVALSDLPGQPTRLGDQPTARIVIVSDDSEIFFTAPSYSVGESIPSASASITISRTGSVSVPASVEVRTTDGTAVAGADYTAINNTVSFAIGESERTLAIGITPDQLVEGNEFFNVTLSNPSAGASLRPGASVARITIVDDDFAPGEIRFERASYSVREGNTVAQVAVIRTNGLSKTVTVTYSTQAASATPGDDYEDVTGVLTFNDGESLKFIPVPIHDDNDIENNDVVNLTLSNVSGGATLGLNTATLTIIDDDLGSGSIDTDFDPGVGANGPIRAIEYDGRNRLLIGGDFTAFNNDFNRNRIARLLTTGAIDTTFSTNNRPNNGVAALALQPDLKILMGGSFNTVQGQVDNRVARLLPEGAVDPSFSLRLGLNAQVSTIAVQPDGKLVIGGVFTMADAAIYRHITRINTNGTVDVTFDTGTGADDNVNALVIQPDNKILVGGAFGSFNGIGAGRIVRLNADGSVDTGFRTGTGFSRADGKPAVVYDILLLSSGRILVAGDFTSYNGTPRQGIAMLDVNGTLQSFGSTLQSVNGAIRTIALQRTDRNSDDKIIIGGDFTSVDGTPRNRVARLDATGKFDPSLDPGDGANARVLGLFVQPWDGRIVVVGEFTEFNNNPNLRGIARLNNDKAFLPPPPNEIHIGSVSLAAGGLQVTFESQAGVTYAIEGSNDFVTWTTDRVVSGSGSTTTVQIPNAGAYRFFRVHRQ